tara:strand:- start:1941 stop:3272 length:1332 start_codon:yes stop_codon:yes gene_type:complete
MIKTPFIQIKINPKQGESLDISYAVTKFMYEESINKDNIVELNIVSSYVTILSNLEQVQEGAELEYTFGYIGGGKSPTHRAIITDLDHSFDYKNINMTIRALDKGSVLKKTSSSQMYENVTSTDIAQLIATRHSMGINIDKTTKVWAKQPQGNLDDLTFLRKIASQEKSGNYIVFIKDNILNFVRRGLNTSSLITYTYGEGNNGILLFQPRFRESTATPDAMGSSSVGFDPLEKLFNIVEEKAESENEVITTGDYHLIYSADGEHVANGTDNESFSTEGAKTETATNGKSFVDSGIESIVKTGKQFVSGAFGQDLKDKNAGNKKSKTTKILEATLNLVGNPLLKVNALLTMANVTKRYNGNWFIVSCRHTINGTSYLTETTLNRNGSKKPIVGKNTKTADQANKTTGDNNSVNDEVIILEYDANGNRTADITTANNYVPPQDI